MGTLIVTEFVTLDGVGQGPGGPDEDREGGFEFGGWQAPYPDEQAGEEMFTRASSMEALLLGRKTYDIWADYWPNGPDIPWTELINRVPKYIASHTLSDPLAWDGCTVLGGDLGAEVAAIKERHDEVHVIGSLDLVQSLLTLGLVDRINLWVYPLLLGTGKKAFTDGIAPAALRLVESVTYPSGTIHLTYEPIGAPTFGDMTVVE